jgi:hypothetical protein
MSANRDPLLFARTPKPDGHTRLCAACYRSYYLPWVPGPLEEVPWRCNECCARFWSAQFDEDDRG